jgi:hypothetical protein
MPIIGIISSAQRYGDFVLLGTAVASGGETNLTFNNIVGSYTNLFLVTSLRSQATGDGSGMTMRFNNDTASNYTCTNLAAYRTGGSSSRDSSIDNSDPYLYFEVATSDGNTSNSFGSGVVDIVGYAGSTFKHAIAYSGFMPTNPSTRYSYQQVRAGNWQNTAPITRIDINAFGAGFVTGSLVSLYGVK